MDGSRPLPVVITPSRHVKGGSQSTVVQTTIFEGWLLKKRRKKMQGFARRYFTLSSLGQLSYAFEPGKPSRDSIVLSHAAVSTYPGRKDIHIDSANVTFHLKCLSSEDFGKWMVAFRRFIATDGRKSSMGLTTPRVVHVTRSSAVVDEMGLTIAELETALVSWQSDDTTSSKTHKDKKAEKEKHKEEKREKKQMKKFGVFGKSNEPSDAQSEVSPDSPQYRVHIALEALKSQHEILAKHMHMLTHFDTGTAPSTARGSPLPTTAEEDEKYHSDSPQSIYNQSRFTTSFSRHPTRTSIASGYSESANSHEWFDAPEAGEEYVLEAEEDELDEPTPSEEKSEREGGLASDPNGSSVAESSSDADEGEEKEEESISKNSHEEAEEEAAVDLVEQARQVSRRTSLPSGPVGDDGSLFAVLKKNVGKDLGNISFPVSFNEPITLLQNSAEQVEYYDLLRQAVAATDPVERMCFVAAFAISGYAHTRHRSGRKSFNPMLAETYEDPRMKFIAEKVIHHPFVMAYHAEGDGWDLSATSSGKTKFWGKSLEIIPLGTTHLKIGDDHYTWNKPSSFMRNLMVGTKYLEHQGKMTIDNKSTRARCILEFKQSGYFAASNQVEGTVFSPSGKAETHLEGKWDEGLAQNLQSSHLRVLWKMAPFPRHAEENYGFTSFGITLNEITDDIQGKLPPTDSRFRPDVRALEDGDIDEAEKEKVRLEEWQRDRRKRGQDRAPRWFKQEGDEWVYKGGYWEARANGWQEEKIEPLW